ncbi:hypothetical protein O181_090544 [Austropuccinia psidii MF-1]|uniref:Uncharacterized protein n=1 Tax=Austropuccinia psidii MF-1 TaxID=1389203 RepID=A0A9Q3IVM7_9BASI|nr:hypothetical protein [Austropuccinia psidii MF-1]
MSTHCYSSMCMCMCQYCSTQTHSSPEGDTHRVAFTHFQYKQHIKKFKSTIPPKYLPNIPTSASGSECPKILLDQILPAHYSQLTQSTFPQNQVSIKLHRNHTAAVKPFPHKTLEWNI